MAPIIEVKNLRTYFNTPKGTARAVDGVSFNIDAGETLALVGESGCGKSMTALSLIQLVPEPNGFIAEGEILLDGLDITRLPEYEKRRIRGNDIAMIFQEPMTSLNPVLTIGSQIIETIRLHQGLSQKAARAHAIEMLDRMKLPSPKTLIDEYPHRLSGGMRQRIMIAMALACKPKLLIADEPTTALDVTIQREILSLIKELKEELGTAVLLITHNLALVSGNADKVGVMYGGKIVESASAKDIFKNPLHPYTKSLLHSLPSITNRNEGLETIEGTVPEPTNFPKGCRFAKRCSSEMEGCSRLEPTLTAENKEDHLVSCHLFDPEFMSESRARPAGKMREPVMDFSRVDDSDAATRPLVLEVKGLKVHYPIKKGIFKKTVGHVRAVDGIDISIERGSTLALVGESGCGKTTTGKAIMQLIDATEGSVLLKGKELTTLNTEDMRPMRELMQIIFQDPYSSLNPRIKVGGIIEEGLKSLKPDLNDKERKDKVSEVLRMVGLSSDMSNRYPHEFSGGQRSRIGIARVLVVEPELIICDEATSALDVSVQAQILNLLRSVQIEFGLSYLFITHDLGIVEYMADKVAVMYEGKVIEYGRTEEVLGRPKEEYTKKLLQAVPTID